MLCARGDEEGRGSATSLPESPEVPGALRNHRDCSFSGCRGAVGERFLCPAGEARHAFAILKPRIPASLIFAHAVALFLFTKEPRVAQDGALCFHRKRVHCLKQSGVGVFGHRWKLSNRGENVDGEEGRGGATSLPLGRVRICVSSVFICG